MSSIFHLSEAARRVLLIDAEPKRQKLVKQIFTRVFGAPDVRDALGELPPPGDYNLIVVHVDGVSAADRARLQEYSGRSGETKVLLLSSGSDRQQMSELFSAKAMTNLLATSATEGIDVDDLIVTCQKILRRDIFGIEKYFVWGVSSRSGQVTRSAEKDAFLRGVQDYTAELGIPQRLATLFENVADEFVSNALYNSPIDANGQYRFASVSRTEAVTLEPGEKIEITLSCDGRRIGVSIADPFGSLAQATILDYLAKCFRKDESQVDDKPGGAGLGFYQILDALSHFVINIQPGRQTEMIGLIDISGSYKDFVVKGKSFNIFVVDG